MPHRAVLIGVFPPHQAPRLRARLREVGVAPSAVRFDDPDDARWALHAEQQEETDRAAFAPQAGVLLPKEAAKTTTIAVPMGAAIGGVIMAPLAIVPMGELAWWGRLLWLVAIGVAAGATVAFIAGAAMATKDPLEPSVVERGVVVRVDADDPVVRSTLIALHPVRLDRVRPDGTVERLETEEDREPGGAIEETLGNVAREARTRPTDRHR